MPSFRQKTTELLDQALSAAAPLGRKLPEPAKNVARSLRDQLADASAAGSQPVPSESAQAAAVKILNAQEKNLRYDVQTMAIIERVMKPGDLAIDVGAHAGAILDHMVAASPNTRHLAFEPLPHLAAALRADYPGVEVHEGALVEEPDGNLEFHHVVSNPGYSGIRRRSYDRPDETVEKISVPTLRLDDVVGPDRNPVLIKIDVEGAELGVLRGGRQVLTRAKPILVFENGLGAANHYGTTPADVFSTLAECGLSISLLGTWLEDGPPLSLEQYEAQFNSGANFYFVGHPTPAA